jgi:hypothetical protein
MKLFIFLLVWSLLPISVDAQESSVGFDSTVRMVDTLESVKHDLVRVADIERISTTSGMVERKWTMTWNMTKRRVKTCEEGEWLTVGNKSFALSGELYQHLTERGSHVLIFIDEDNQQIGFLPCEDGNANGYSLQSYGRKVAAIKVARKARTMGGGRDLCNITGEWQDAPDGFTGKMFVIRLGERINK